MNRTEPNNSGIAVFDKKLQGASLYQQYRSQQWLRDYIIAVDNFVQERYFNRLMELWEQIDVAESQMPYLTFYTKWLFGLYRPLSGSSLAEYYDSGLSYDLKTKYDDAAVANGLITGQQYLKYIKFIIDYSQETWTIDYIMRFVADYCEISPNDIALDYSDKNVIKVILPNNSVTNEFVKMELNYRDEIGLPFGSCIEFVLDMTGGQVPKDRHIVYDPQNPVYNRYEESDV